MSENLPRIYYRSSEKYALLPEWAYFFMRLGHQIAGISRTKYRVVVGLAIPTRVFACSLVSTGIVIKKAGSDNPVDPAQIQFILDLHPGTSVFVRKEDNRRYPGVIERFRVYNGKQMVDIRFGSKETRSLPVDRYASRITISEQDSVSLPLYKAKGYSIKAPSEFLRACLGEELAQKHILDSFFQALLVGKKNRLEDELNANCFSCDHNDKFTNALGCLQEIVRVKQFSSKNASYNTQCISQSNITPEKEIGTQIPPIVVFDGAIAYIKLGYKWRSAHQIVLLDRTERQFGDAVELLNQNYTYRLEGSFKFPIRIPDGIEMMVYRDSVQ